MKVHAKVTLPAKLRGCFAISHDRTRAVVTTEAGAASRLFVVELAGTEVVELGQIGGVVAVDAAVRRAVVTMPGRSVEGVHTWATELRELDGVGPGRTLHRNQPDDCIRSTSLDADGGWAIRTRGTAESLVRFDLDARLVAEWPIPVVAPATELIALDDGRILLGDWSNRLALFDPVAQTFSMFEGNRVDWGGDHDLVARDLAVTGDLVFSDSHDGTRMHLWSLASRAPLGGAWTDTPITQAGLLGDGTHVVVVTDSTLAIRHAVTGALVESRELPAGGRVTIPGDGSHVAIATPGAITAWNVWSDTQVKLGRAGRARLIALRGMLAILDGKTAHVASAEAIAR